THSQEAYETAIKTTDFLDGNGSLALLNQLNDTEPLEFFEGLPRLPVANTELSSGINTVHLLSAHAAVFPSKGEARKMIQGGGVSINKQKIDEPAQIINTDRLLNGKYLVAQRGKKNYFLLIAE